MDHPFFVGGGEPRRYGDPVFDGFARDEGAVAEQVAHRMAVQELADDVGCAFVRADVVDREDVRMVQRCSGAGFLFEAPEPVGIRRVDVRQDLDRDVTSKTRVVREIDLAHSSTAQQIQDLVRAEQSAGDQGHESAVRGIIALSAGCPAADTRSRPAL